MVDERRAAVNCFGLGGRQARTDPKLVISLIIMRSAMSSKMEFACLPIRVSKTARMPRPKITSLARKAGQADWQSVVWSKGLWKYKRTATVATICTWPEHQAMYEGIRSGNIINNGDYMCKSTLLAIMGRMATYTGQLITWDMAMNSKEDLTPPSYDLEGKTAGSSRRHSWSNRV